MHLHDDSSLVSWDEAARLFPLVGWNARLPEDLQLAFASSVVRAFAVHESRLVGIARAIGDGVYYASIVDVIVHPDLQRSGVGTALVTFLEARLSSLILLTLTAAPAVQPFYERIGWRHQTTAMIRPCSTQQEALNCPPAACLVR